MLKNSQLSFENEMDQLQVDIKNFNEGLGHCASPFKLCYHGISGHKISPTRINNRSKSKQSKNKVSRPKKIIDRMKNYNKIKQNSSKYHAQGNHW